MEKLPILQTQRMVLRLPEITEASQILRFYQNNREHLGLWEPERPHNFYHVSFWEDQIRMAQKEFLSDLSFKVHLFEKETGELIGMNNFTNFERGVFQSCRLGYKIDRKFEGKDFMFESLESSIQYVFHELHFHRIEANFIPRNKKSGKLLSRLDFKIIGQEENYLKINGKWEDHTLTSLKNPNWILMGSM